MKAGRTLSILFIAALLPLLTDCSGGGGGSEDVPATSACAALGLNQKIVMGTECSENGSPVVQVLLDLGPRAASCTGTMLTATNVLTAAHCFFRPPISTYVRYGNRLIRVSRVTSHPNVTRRQDAVINDVAILTLSEPLPIPTLPLALGQEVRDGDIIQIFGFGRTEQQTDDNETAGTLRSGEMELTEVTQDSLESVYDGEGSNTCHGDSGGPAILVINGRPGVVGVASTGTRTDCLIGDRSLFVNIQSPSVLAFVTDQVPAVGAI